MRNILYLMYMHFIISYNHRFVNYKSMVIIINIIYKAIAPLNIYDYNLCFSYIKMRYLV